MRDFMIEPVADPVAEARRYVENAKELLKDHGQLDYENRFYGDRKYVRMAGNTLWNGMLLILKAAFQIKKNKGRLSIEDIRTIINKRDGKLMTLVNTGYDIMHLSMGYDGILNKDVCQAGIRTAEEIIERCEVMLRKVAKGILQRH